MGIATFTTSTVAANGADLALATSTSEQTPPAGRLLIIHGFTGAKEDFTEWLAPVAGLGWDAAAVDLVGHGESAKPDGIERYSFEALAADAVAVVDALGWDRFTILGHSMGGMITQHVALSEAGARLDGMILLDTSHGPVERIERQLAELACAVVSAGGMPALVETTAALRREGKTPLATAAQVRVLAERPGHEEFNTRKLLAMAPDAYRALVLALFDQADRLERLAALHVPVLVMVGEQDEPFLASSRRLAATIPGASLEIIPDAGHSPQFENPIAFWAVLSGFLGELS